MKACMVAQSMSGDANKGDNEVEDLDGGDDRPHGASLPSRVQGPRSRVQGARWTSRSGSSREKNRGRGLLARTSEQEQWATSHVTAVPSTSSTAKILPSFSSTKIFFTSSTTTVLSASTVLPTGASLPQVRMVPGDPPRTR